jgi:hypothetical protein
MSPVAPEEWTTLNFFQVDIKTLQSNGRLCVGSQSRQKIDQVVAVMTDSRTQTN